MILLDNPKPVHKLRVVDSILYQNHDWEAGFFDFGKQKKPDVDYFNCGLVERPDGVWLVTRRSKAHPKMKIGLNDIACFLLDGKTPVRIYGAKIKAMFPGLEHFEDPRAVYHNGLTYISCCNFVMRDGGWTGAHQIVAAMDNNWNTVQRYDPVYGGNGKTLGENTRIEKNWILWWRNGIPHIIYLMEPHTVVQCDVNFVPQQVHETSQELPWEYGQPRGGTPPILIGNEYWCFFHSSTVWREKRPTRQYHMGAYAFESKPPFRITKITTEPLLSGSPYDRWAEGKPLVVFPNGSLLRDGKFFVTLGVNDLDAAWVEIPHKDLLKEMVDCG